MVFMVSIMELRVLSSVTVKAYRSRVEIYSNIVKFWTFEVLGKASFICKLHIMQTTGRLSAIRFSMSPVGAGG